MTKAIWSVLLVSICVALLMGSNCASAPDEQLTGGDNNTGDTGNNGTNDQTNGTGGTDDGTNGGTDNNGGTNGTATFTLQSAVFTNGGTIPVAHAVAGSNASPPLTWSGAPAGTQQYALIMTDTSFIDGLVHWIVYSIPGTANSLPQGIAAGEGVTDPAGAKQGLNFLDETAYSGPDPGPETHQYKFELYALDSALSLANRLSRADLLAAMQGHILGKAELTGSYTGN